MRPTDKDLNEYNDLDAKMEKWWDELDEILDRPSDTEKALIELQKELKTQKLFKSK